MNAGDASMSGIIGTGQPSVLVLSRKELSIERSPISRSYLPRILYNNQISVIV